MDVTGFLVVTTDFTDMKTVFFENSDFVLEPITGKGMICPLAANAGLLRC
jgi:hypothetical protein